VTFPVVEAGGSGITVERLRGEGKRGIHRTVSAHKEKCLCLLRRPRYCALEIQNVPVILHRRMDTCGEANVMIQAGPLGRASEKHVRQTPDNSS
jgi:hypothetical protein